MPQSAAGRDGGQRDFGVGGLSTGTCHFTPPPIQTMALVMGTRRAKPTLEGPDALGGSVPAGGGGPEHQYSPPPVQGGSVGGTGGVPGVLLSFEGRSGSMDALSWVRREPGGSAWAPPAVCGSPCAPRAAPAVPLAEEGTRAGTRRAMQGLPPVAPPVSLSCSLGRTGASAAGRVSVGRERHSYGVGGAAPKHLGAAGGGGHPPAFTTAEGSWSVCFFRLQGRGGP